MSNTIAVQPKTALHAWLTIADAIRDHSMPPPAGVAVYDGTAPNGPARLATIDLHTPADAQAWADHLGLEPDPTTAWAASYISLNTCWSVRCMTDRSAERVARPRAGEVTSDGR